MTFDVPEADATAFADTYQVPIAGKISASIEIQGTVDPAATQGVDTLFDARLDGVKTTSFQPTGQAAASGQPNYNCTASGLTGTLFQSLRIVYAVGDAARYTAVLQNSGSTVRATS